MADTNSTARRTFLHYSIPGNEPHVARTADREDARDIARKLTVRTGYLAAILAHYAENGVEVIELFEIVNP